MSTTTPDLVPYDEVIAEFDPVLGLEVHVELGTETKMFCGCPTGFGAAPNTQVCPTCLGLPGSLPVVNEVGVESAIRIGLALNCQIAQWCRFARKNYFYPDMPKNFQTSQYDEPIAFDGYLDVDVETDEGVQTFRVAIERAHMEEDTGKTTHQGGATGRIHGADYSLVDYNRAGIPLIEIVTKPIEGTGKYAPEVARAYVTALRELLRGLGVSDVKMEQGSLRCDANVSLRPTPESTFGTRTETKNVNSLRSVERAVRYEMQRQAAVLREGGRITQETRHWHEDTGVTTSGREKSDAEDYRYFPEPDLVPIAPSREWVEQLRATLPENPAVRRARLQAAWGISDFDMTSVINAGALDAVEQTVALGADQAAAFDARAKRLGAQYSAFEPAPGVHINGDLTMGENIADLGGVNVSLEAYHRSLNGAAAPVLDGFTGDQRFFLGWAQAWRGKARDSYIKKQVVTDPHSPRFFRIIGPTRNVDAWYAAFGVKPGEGYYVAPDQRVRIW